MKGRGTVIVELTDSIEILSNFDTQEYTLRERQQLHGSVIAAIQDALELLKSPRVMTLEEVKQERICWIEDADDGMTIRLFPATMFGIGEYANGSKSYMFLAQKPWAIDTNNCEWWYLIEDYGEIWRCWTSRPTDEQREAIPGSNG